MGGASTPDKAGLPIQIYRIEGCPANLLDLVQSTKLEHHLVKSAPVLVRFGMLDGWLGQMWFALSIL